MRLSINLILPKMGSLYIYSNAWANIYPMLCFSWSREDNAGWTADALNTLEVKKHKEFHTFNELTFSSGAPEPRDACTHKYITTTLFIFATQSLAGGGGGAGDEKMENCR